MRFRLELLLSAPLLLFPGVARAQVGSPYCLGVQCPCANDDPQAGCGNSGFDGDFSSGARLLAAAGSTNVFADDLVLAVEGIAPGRFGVLVAGNSTGLTPLGDGLLCVAGDGSGVQRIQPKTAGVSGRFAQTRFVENLASSAIGPIAPGTTLHFQAYYRDASGPCGTGFNLSNALAVTFTAGPVILELVGEPLAIAPHFDFVNAFNAMAPVSLTLDPLRFPHISNQQALAYITEGRTRAGWDRDPKLVDVRGAATALDFQGGDLASNITILDTGTLAGPLGTDLSRGYDVVIDFDGDGLLSDGDFIDGRGDEHGFAVFRDMVQPGPFGTVELIHDHGGPFQRQNIFYPANIAELGQLPLVVIGHGNGHGFTWYDHIGLHMASYGYIAMSHRNNTNPGPGAASTTTLTNTDVFIEKLADIDGGALVGHLDSSQIIWIGHSRGGEGVARAYQRILSGVYVPDHFGVDDIQLVSSIAPTDFLGHLSNPEGVPFQLWTGAADNDVSGVPGNVIAQTYHLLTRAEGQRMGVTYHGVGHGAFHNGNGSLVATGPCIVGRADTHRLMKGYFLPTIVHVLGRDAIAEEFLWRKWESLRPIGAPAEVCPDVVYEYWSGPSEEAFVIDDFQSELALRTSSSGTAVSGTVEEWLEGRLQDGNNNLTSLPNDPMNGMTRNGPQDNDRGIVFQWAAPEQLEFEVAPAGRNFATYKFLSFRACQSTRHALTIADDEDLTFFVTLRDGHGVTATLNISAYKGGITEPYARSSTGQGVGWVNEFETTRMRLADFATGNPNFDLTDVVAVRFDFGRPGASQVGRIGMDDIELVQQ